MMQYEDEEIQNNNSIRFKSPETIKKLKVDCLELHK